MNKSTKRSALMVLVSVVASCALTVACLSTKSDLAQTEGNLLAGQTNLLQAFQASTPEEFQERMDSAIEAQVDAAKKELEFRIREAELKESIPPMNLIGGSVGIIAAAIAGSRKLSKSGGRIDELRKEIVSLKEKQG